jgi:ribosome-binding factor A
MTWDRIQRQEAILREKIAVIVLERLNDPRLGFVTITEASLSQDKHYCTVKYTVMGSDADRSRSSRALDDAAPRVRELLAPTLNTRVLPEVRFVYDAVVVKETRLRGLIEEVTAERLERTGEPDNFGELDAESEAGETAEPDADSGEDEQSEETTAGLPAEVDPPDESEDEGADGRA